MFLLLLLLFLQQQVWANKIELVQVQIEYGVNAREHGN